MGFNIFAEQENYDRLQNLRRTIRSYENNMIGMLISGIENILRDCEQTKENNLIDFDKTDNLQDELLKLYSNLNGVNPRNLG